MLSDAWPDQRVEVFNAGITAVASFPVLETVRASAELDPDLVVVYTGHNELFGVYGAASVRIGGDGLLAKELHQFVLGTRLGGLVARLLDGAGSPGNSPTRSLLQAMSSVGAIPPQDPRRARALASLGTNLTAIVSWCRDRHIPVILCNLVCNERGFAPGVATAPGVEQGAYEAALVEARRELGAAAWGRALEAARRARSLQPQGASAVFLEARALEGLGQTSAAGEAYAVARDLDPRPFRATSRANVVIREVARAEGAVLADVDLAFHAAAPGAGVGWELMDDHLHPSTAGEAVLARAVVKAMADLPGILAVSPEAGQRLASDDDYRRRLGDLPVEQLAVCHSMAGLLSEPPMDCDNQERLQQLRVQADSLWKVLVPGEKRGVERWRSAKGPDLLVLNVADQLFADGRFDLARPYYDAASLEEPYTIGSDVWARLRWARCGEMLDGVPRQGDMAQLDAMSDRLELLALAPDLDPFLLKFLRGYREHLASNHSTAVRLLQEAASDPGVRRTFAFDLLALLSEELAHAGRWDEACRWVEEVSTETRQQDYGRFLVARLQRRQGGPAR
jgi:tetratricopeptide (TPR) repeat protein